MAEDFSSRQPARDARLDELLAESRALLRGQEQLGAELREQRVRQAREAPRFEAPQRQLVREEPEARPQEQARALERRLTSERGVAEQSRRASVAAEENAATQARKAEGALKAAQTRLATLRNLPADQVTPQRITSAESSVARASEKARVARQEADAARKAAQAASDQERALRAAAKEAREAAVAAETEAAARERSARAARQTGAPRALPRGVEPAPDVGLSARTVRRRTDVEADIRRESQIAENYAESLRARAQRLGRSSNPQASSVYRGYQANLGALREEADLMDRKAAAERAGTPAEAEYNKRLQLFREGKALTGQQTAAEVEQLGVIKQQVRAVQDLRASQREPSAPVPKPPVEARREIPPTTSPPTEARVTATPQENPELTKQLELQRQGKTLTTEQTVAEREQLDVIKRKTQSVEELRATEQRLTTEATAADVYRAQLNREVSSASAQARKAEGVAKAQQTRLANLRNIPATEIADPQAHAQQITRAEASVSKANEKAAAARQEAQAHQQAAQAAADEERALRGAARQARAAVQAAEAEVVARESAATAVNTQNTAAAQARRAEGVLKAQQTRLTNLRNLPEAQITDPQAHAAQIARAEGSVGRAGERAQAARQEAEAAQRAAEAAAEEERALQRTAAEARGAARAAEVEADARGRAAVAAERQGAAGAVLARVPAQTPVTTAEHLTRANLPTMNKAAEMVPTSAMVPLREFDRTPEARTSSGVLSAPDRANWYREYYSKLKQSIEAEGIKNPIRLSFNPQSGRSYISEGNTRLAIAQELGMQNVPVIAKRDVTPSLKVPGGGYPGLSYLPGGRVGGAPFPPSALGLPLASEQRVEAELQKQLDLSREGKSLTAEQTAAEAEKLGVIKQETRATEELRAAQRAPVPPVTPAVLRPAQGEVTAPVRPAVREQQAGQGAVVRTRQDVENELKATQRSFDQYRDQLYQQGKVPTRRSSTVRDFEGRLSALRQEREAFPTPQPAEAELQKRLGLLREGRSLTGQQTAAEAEQLAVIKQQVKAVEELRAAQRAPAPQVVPPVAPPRLDQGEISQRLETLANLRRQIPFGNLRAAPSPIIPGSAPYGPNRAAEEESRRLAAEESRRVAAEERVAAVRAAAITRAAVREAEILAEREAAERRILLDRQAAEEAAGRGALRNQQLAADFNRAGVPPRGLRPTGGAFESGGYVPPRGGVLQYGQPAGDRSGAGPVLRRGFAAPVSGFQGLEGAGVVQNYARSTDQAMGAITAAERAQKSLPAFYRELQRGSVIQAGASQQMRRHGALTTEFLSALARGETTLAEFRFQIGSTIAKFGGWTVAAASVYGVIGAISTLSRGARDSLSGVQQLNRFITNVNTKDAAKGFRDVSREVNVSIGDVANAQANFLRIYHDQGQALEASRTALKLTKLDNLSAADSLRFLTASAQEFKLPASQIVVLGDKLANVFRRMGVPIQESLPAFARSAAVVRNAGGELTELIELIAIARRQTGQTGNTIGTALARSAATFVNRPSSQTVFKQLGLDPKQASDDYTKFVLSAIRRARTLSAPEIRELAAAIGGPQFGARIFTGLLRGYRLLPQAAKAAGSESAGTLDKELKVKLAQVDEQISKVGNSLERLGSGLASAGAFAPLGLALKTLNAILDTANDLTGAFASLPGPFKAITVALGEAYLALKLLRRSGLGGGLAERTGLGYLGYSPQEQLRRGTIITQRNLGQGLANEAEQLGNRYQAATSGSVAAAELAIREQKKVVRLAGVANVDQRLVAEAEARTIAFQEQSARLNAEALALKGEIEVNARLQAEADARLLGLQKRRILPSQVAAEQGGAVVVAGPQRPRVVTTEEAKAIEGGKAPLFVKAPPTVPSGEGLAAEGAASAESAKASARAAAAASGLIIPARAAEKMAQEAAAAETLAAAAVNAEAVALEAQAVENVGLGASFARLGRSSLAAGRSAALTARETSIAALRGFGALVADPLVIGLAAFEILPAIYHSGTKRIKAEQDRAARLARDPQSQSDLQDVLAQARKTAEDVGQVGHDDYNIALKTIETERRVAAAQAKSRRLNRPVPLRFVQGISADFENAVNQRRQGIISERELQAAYAKAQTELEHSRQATSGSAADAKVVAAAEKKFGLAILEATNGQKALAQALKEQSLGQIAQALQDEADQIAVFGAQPGDTKRINAQFAEAASRVAKDPSAKNLKAYGAARSALDKTLQDAQTQLQQSLTIATTGSQRSAAYSEYFKTIEGESGVDKIRANVVAARSRAASAAQALGQAKLAPPAVQPQKTFGDTGKAFGAFAGADASAQLGAPAAAISAKKALENQRAGIDELRKNFGKNSAEVRRLTALYKRAKLALDAMEQDARTQEAQSQNQVAELKAQLRAGRAGSATEAIAIQLRAAHEALRNDIKHDVGEEQRLQDKLKIQQLQDQQLQTAIQQIQTKSALATSRIDPVNQGAVDRSNLSGLYQELARARAARPGPARDDQIRQVQTQINTLRFQAAQNIRQQAQSENDAYFAYLEAGLASINPLRVAQLEYQKTLVDLKYAHGKTERLQALANIKAAQQAVADAVRQNAIDENDAYYAYREAGLGTLHPVQVARLEYQKALGGLKFARNKIERLQALAQIKNAQEALAEAVHQNAIDEVNAYFGLAESKTTDPLKLAQLEYQKALALQKKARGPKEKQQTAIDKNNALKNLYQTQADERLKTIEFEASIDKITSDQEIGALKNLLKLKHLTKDFRRQILTQIHQLENQDSSSVELNVGNIRLPTLYDVRRLAAQGTNNQPVISTQTVNIAVNGANDPQETAYAVSAVLNKHTRTHHKAAQRAAGIR